MKRIIALSAIASLALGLTACDEEELIACTDDARVSVNLSVVDEDGAAVADVIVEYAVDGAAAEDCERFGSTDEFYCGTEIAGEFVISASAEGFEDGELILDVEEDECHVIPQSAEIVLLAITE